MTYATLMVNVDPGGVNAAVLEATGDLAERLHSRVIGIAVGRLATGLYADGYVGGALIDQEYAAVEELLKAAEAEFRRAMHNRAASIEWRSRATFEPAAAYVAAQARSADLLVTGGGVLSSVETGDLVMQAGRPVLTAPPGVVMADARRVVIAWKDTREARRAAYDALPLLRLAESIAVVEIAADDELADAQGRTRDVVDWLARHGVTADAIASAAQDDDHQRLHEIARDRNAGLIVAGAYGHSRLREWIIGGVTRALLADPAHRSLLSH